MRTAPLPAVLLLVLAVLGLGTACTTPPPRIPFRDTAWHASVLGGTWTINQFVDEAEAIGIEMVVDEPGTSGWAFEFGARYAKGDDNGNRTVKGLDANDNVVFNSSAPSYREIDFYEIDFGVRQIFRPDARLQPYFGLGGALIQARSLERYTQPEVANPDVQIPPLPPVVQEENFTDHERGEIRPGFYMRTGLVMNVLRDQVREKTEFPIGLDVRGLLSVDYSYLEFTFSFGFGR